MLRDIILIATAAFFGGFLARTVKLPSVLGYIASGILFSVLGRPFLSSYEGLLEISQLGISLLLFTHGFEITLDALKKIDKHVFIIGVLQVCFTSFVLFPVLLLVGLPTPVAILFAILFSFSSTTIIIKLLEEKGALHNFPGSDIFVLLLVQDLFVVPVILFFPILFGRETGPFNQLIISFFISAIKPLLVFFLVLIFSKFFLSRVLNIIFRYPSHELTILATIFTASIAIGLFKYAGLPDAIAAFLAGVIISEQGKNLAPLTEIRPLRDLFLVIFFVLTGMLFSMSYFLEHFWIIIPLTAVVILIKFLIIFCLLRVGLYKLGPSFVISSYLINIGEFAIVISQLALLNHYISNNAYYLTLSVFILSLACIPFENTLFEKMYFKIRGHKLLSKLFPEVHYKHVSIKTQILKDHVIICGHGRVGSKVRSMLELAGIPYIVIDFNRSAVQDLQDLGKHALYGDPTDSDILEMAHIKTAKALVVALPAIDDSTSLIAMAKKQNRDILIISRVHNERDELELSKKGIEHTVFPEAEAGIKLGLVLLDTFHVAKKNREEYLQRIGTADENKI